MRQSDPNIEQTIQEIAEILARGYLRLLEKSREGTAVPTATSGTSALEEERTPPPKPMGGRRSKAERAEPPEPQPAAPMASRASRPDVPEVLRAEIAERLQKLAGMNSRALSIEYQRVFNAAPRSANRQHLLRRISWEIQAQAEGRLSQEIREYACRVAEQTDMFRRIDEALGKRRASAVPPGSADVPKTRRRPPQDKSKKRDPRLPPPGSFLIVKYGRETARVAVLQSGFEYAGKTYRSLTAVARQLAGRNVNAYEFFGLGPPARPTSDRRVGAPAG